MGKSGQIGSVVKRLGHCPVPGWLRHNSRRVDGTRRKLARRRAINGGGIGKKSRVLKTWEKKWRKAVLINVGSISKLVLRDLRTGLWKAVEYRAAGPSAARVWEQ